MNTIWIPFRLVSSADCIGMGSSAQVFAIDDRLALKCPIRFKGFVTDEIMSEVEMNKQRIDREKEIYRVLMDNPHPCILQAVFLDAPEGIFMVRTKTDLESRLHQQPISKELKAQWIRQLSSAVAWLEKLEYFHNDLRPGNIFLDHNDNVKLGDFGNGLKQGELVEFGGQPYCKLGRNFESPLADAVNEQYALASCIYVIKYGHEPWHKLDSSIMTRKLIQNEFPDTSGPFSEVIQKGWHGDYKSIRAMAESILDEFPAEVDRGEQSMGCDEVRELAALCGVFIKNYRKVE